MRALELKVPPPIVTLVWAGLMWLASRAAPALAFALPAASAIAIGLAVAGFVTAIAGATAFRRARTTVNPMRPEASSALVTTGVYARSRNPMYLGLLLLLLGWAVYLSNALAFLALPAFVLYLNRFQIRPEERALAARFGDGFAAYRAQVRRWI